MRCITAIWPAGPPKLRLATLSQTWKASGNEGCRGAAAAGTASTESASVTSHPRLLGVSGLAGRGLRVRGLPGMSLLGGVAAPPVERVIERHSGFELGKVVGVHPRQSQRGGEQAGGLRSGIEVPGIGATHDGGEAQQCRRGQLELL